MLADKLRAATPVSAAPSNTPVLTFEAGATTTADLTTATFDGVSIGTADPDRYIVVAAGSRISTATTASDFVITIAGVTASSLVQVVNVSAPRNAVGIFMTNAPVSTGSTTSITVRRQGTTQSNTAIAVYSIVRDVSAPIVLSTRSGFSFPTGISTTARLGSTGGVTVSTVAITAAFGGAAGTVIGPNISGPVTSNYYTGITELTGFRSVTITANTSYEWTLSGTGANMGVVHAIWR